jgi:hypothetical protein
MTVLCHCDDFRHAVPAMLGALNAMAREMIQQNGHVAAYLPELRTTG